MPFAAWSVTTFLQYNQTFEGNGHDEKYEATASESTFDLPLGYFMNNMYEDEELSVENLLPSLRPEDFSSTGAAGDHYSHNFNYNANQINMQSC